MSERAFYPIRYLPGYGITARIWHTNRDAARRHVRRLYHEGTQLAFCYYEGDAQMHRQALQRLREFMEEGD